jgi:hypothetical protein
MAPRILDAPLNTKVNSICRDKIKKISKITGISMGNLLTDSITIYTYLYDKLLNLEEQNSPECSKIIIERIKNIIK